MPVRPAWIGARRRLDEASRTGDEHGPRQGSAAIRLRSSTPRKAPAIGVTFGILSTYPPTRGGPATIAHALATQLAAAGAEVGIVRVVDRPQPDAPLVAHQFVTDRPGAEWLAAAALNSYDVALVQHAYGIYGGPDGAHVLRILAETRVPIISVLHTVLDAPTPNQWRVLAEVAEASSLVVTTTRSARQRLLDGWDVPESRVIVIDHGAANSDTPPPASARVLAPGPLRAVADQYLAAGRRLAAAGNEAVG